MKHVNESGIFERRKKPLLKRLSFSLSLNPFIFLLIFLSLQIQNFYFSLRFNKEKDNKGGRKEVREPFSLSCPSLSYFLFIFIFPFFFPTQSKLEIFFSYFSSLLFSRQSLSSINFPFYIF